MKNTLQEDFHAFLNTFSKLRKVSYSFVMPACLPAHMEQLASTERIFMKIILEFFSKIFQENSSFNKICKNIRSFT